MLWDDTNGPNHKCFCKNLCIKKTQTQLWVHFRKYSFFAKRKRIKSLPQLKFSSHVLH